MRGYTGCSRSFLNASLALLATVVVARAAWAAPSRECLNIRSELANARSRLAAEKRLLQNCQNHLGTCTPGNMQGIQEAIRGLTDEINDDLRRMQQACAGPATPPRHDAVHITDISPDAPFGQDGGGGDPGGQIDAIAADPTNAQVVYAGGETSGVWKSVDGGRNWVHASNGLQWGSTIDNGLAVDPANPRRLLYATTPDDLGPGSASGGWGGHSGLYVSLDAATSWAHVTIPNCVAAYERVLFGKSGALAATYSCGVAVSTTATLRDWRSVLPGGNRNIDDVAVSGDVVYACVGTQVFRSPDLGTTWDANTVGLPGGCYGLAAIPDDPTRFLAIVQVPYTQPDGTASVRYKVGIGNTGSGTAGFGLLMPDLAPEKCCGYPSVMAVKRASVPAGEGPGRSYAVLATNRYRLYEYQPAGGPESPPRWNLVDGLHADIHGVAASPAPAAASCQVFVASDGGVFTNPDGESHCLISHSHFVRAMHGLHAFGTFGIAGIPRPGSACGAAPPCVTIYDASNDNGIWGTGVSGQGATSWADMGCSIGESGTTLVDASTPGQFTSQRGEKLYLWRSSDGSPPLPGASCSEMSVCAPDAAAGRCSAGPVTRVLTLPSQVAVSNGDYFAIHHDPSGGADHIARNTSGAASGWSDVGPAFPAKAADLQVSNGDALPYIYVLATDGTLWRGHIARQLNPPSDTFSGWSKVSAGVVRVGSFAVDPYDPKIVYALDIGDPNSLADDSIRSTANATADPPTWQAETTLTQLATGGGRYRLACGDGAAGAPAANSLNWGENHGYRYECALNQVVFVPGHSEMRFAILSAGVAFTRDSGAHWTTLGGTSPLARPVAAFYDPTVVPGTSDTNLYVGLRGHGVIRMRSHYTP